MPGRAGWPAPSRRPRAGRGCSSWRRRRTSAGAAVLRRAPVGRGFSAQRDRGIADDPERHFADVRRISRGTGREDLTRLSLAEQPAVLEWLLGAGYEIDPATPRVVHGHEPYTTPRTVHAAETPGGPEILRVLRRLLEPPTGGSGRVNVRCGVRVTGLLTEAGTVTGVSTEDGRTWRAPAVVLATGGFGHAPACSPNWRSAADHIGSTDLDR